MEVTGSIRSLTLRQLSENNMYMYVSVQYLADARLAAVTALSLSG